MMYRRQRRRGATLVEGAFVYPILFVVVFAIIILGVSVFRYQQMAHAAREGARYAIVHGAQYAKETGQPAATPQDIYQNAIHPHVGQLANVTYSVTWNQNNQQAHTAIEVDPTTGKKNVVYRANTVSVTVSYSWNTG